MLLAVLALMKLTWVQTLTAMLFVWPVLMTAVLRAAELERPWARRAGGWACIGFFLSSAHVPILWARPAPRAAGAAHRSALGRRARAVGHLRHGAAARAGSRGRCGPGRVGPGGVVALRSEPTHAGSGWIRGPPQDRLNGSRPTSWQDRHGSIESSDSLLRKRSWVPARPLLGSSSSYPPLQRWRSDPRSYDVLRAPSRVRAGPQALARLPRPGVWVAPRALVLDLSLRENTGCCGAARVYNNCGTHQRRQSMRCAAWGPPTVVFGIALLISPAAEARPLFSSPFHGFSVGGSVRDLALADLDGDSNLDLLALTSAANAVLIRLGDGEGDFGSPASIPLAAIATAFAVGDVDGDAHPDLAVVLQSATLSLHHGNGDGSFAAPVDFPVGGSPAGVAIGDLNEDGKPDVVVTSQTALKATILFGFLPTFLFGRSWTSQRAPARHGSNCKT